MHGGGGGGGAGGRQFFLYHFCKMFASSFVFAYEKYFNSTSILFCKAMQLKQ